MSYLFRGRLCGLLCERCREPLSNLRVRIYRNRGDQDVPALAVANPGQTLTLVDDKDLKNKSAYLLAEVETDSDGAFSFMERDLPVSNRRPQPHTHKGPEGFYVLEGSIEFIVGGESRKGGPGFWALAPSGVSHTFGIAGDSPARLWIRCTTCLADTFPARATSPLAACCTTTERSAPRRNCAICSNARASIFRSRW